jgi:hypothetical protein
MNVWLLVFTNVNTERVLGPFTNISIDGDEIRDLLTGRLIAARIDAGWRLNVNDLVIVGRRIVVQQGGFESPWGTRGQ